VRLQRRDIVAPDARQIAGHLADEAEERLVLLVEGGALEVA
jgi:hypothetical protein